MTDWKSAGRKAWETRQRNLAAKAAAASRPAHACPTCGHVPKRVQAKATIRPHELPREVVEAMSDKDFRAWCAKTANHFDVAFSLKYKLPMSSALKADWESLLAQAYALTRTECRRQLRVLQERRWAERDAKPRRKSTAA